MNLSPAWVEFLERCGVESTHWSALGKRDAPDCEILEFAAIHGFVVLTYDLDFGAMLAQRKTVRPSVVQIRSQEVLPSEIGATIVRAIIASQSQLEAGALVTVDPQKNRIRLLPI